MCIIADSRDAIKSEACNRYDYAAAPLGDILCSSYNYKYTDRRACGVVNESSIYQSIF